MSRIVFRIHAIKRMFQRRISEETPMKCVICKNGQTKPGRATVTLERKETTLVVKNVPAKVCANCGEEYVDDKAASRLLKTAEEVAQRGVQVDVRSYEAA